MQTSVSMSSQDLNRQANEMEQAGRILMDTAKKMREAAHMLGGLVSTSATSGDAAKSRSGGRKPTSSKEKTRLQQLIDFVAASGPVSRRDAKSNSGIPPGTVGALLTRKNFSQNEEGKWTVKKEKAQ